jgi:hypothetical protein
VLACPSSAAMMHADLEHLGLRLYSSAARRAVVGAFELLDRIVLIVQLGWPEDAEQGELNPVRDLVPCSAQAACTRGVRGLHLPHDIRAGDLPGCSPGRSSERVSGSFWGFGVGIGLGGIPRDGRGGFVLPDLLGKLIGAHGSVQVIWSHHRLLSRFHDRPVRGGCPMAWLSSTMPSPLPRNRADDHPLARDGPTPTAVAATAAR